MRVLALPFFYLTLIAAAVAAPLYAASILLDIALPGPAPVAGAEAAAAAPLGNAAGQKALAENAPATPQKPVWIAPTRQYNYTPPPLPKVEPAAAERAAPAIKEKTKTKSKEATKRERKPAPEPRQPRATPEALQAFAAEIVPERAINRD